MHRAIHRLVALAISAALIVGGLWAGSLWSSAVAELPASGRLVAGGISDPVSVMRDSRGVPHVQARSLRDAMFALGVAHAQDRLWQMETLRRSAAGRLAEIVGSPAVDGDRLARLLGLRSLAEAELRVLPRESRDLLDAYATGVNRWMDEIRTGSAPLPFEMRWLGVDPQPWTPEDSLAILRMRAWNQGRSLGASLFLDRVVRELGVVGTRDLFPEAPTRESAPRVNALLDLGGVADRLARSTGQVGPVGSLGFLVGAGRTRSGAPILANDPHLLLDLPAAFYLAHIDAPRMEISGATLPGVPVFWVGTNRSIAWGQVALHAAASDLFDETLHPEDPLRYEQDGRWRRASRRREQIAVRGARDVEVEVVSTHRGPLLGALRPDDPRLRTLSLGWTGFGEQGAMDALLQLQVARGWKGFRAALRAYPGPAATFLYADRKGAIGTQVAGRLPLRSIPSGLLPVPGGSRFYDWRGFVPFEDLPSRYGAEIGWIVVSPRVTDAKLDGVVTWLWAAPGGADRLRQRLERMPDMTLEEATELQRETVSADGPRVILGILSDVLPASPKARQVRELLLAWDGGTDRDSPGAALYHLFQRQLLATIVARRMSPDLAREVLALGEPVPGAAAARLFDRARADVSPEDVEQALEQTWSFLRTAISANPRKWTWGHIHELRLSHDFERRGEGSLPWIGRVFGRGPFPVSGDPSSVWAMFHQELPSKRAMVGPALRYVIDMGDANHARAALAGGQSGQPGSRHYDDLLEEWLTGGAAPLWMHRDDWAYHALGVWEVVPAGG